MANPTTTRSSSKAAGTRTPLQGKSTTGFAKGDVSTGPSRHPVLSVPLADSSSKPVSTSLPILPIIHTPSSHSLSRSGWPVISDSHTLPKGSSRKLSQSPSVSPQYEATVKLHPSATHSLVPGSVDTTVRPLIPNSHVTKSYNLSHARDVPTSNAPYEPRSSQIVPTERTAASMSSWIPESPQTDYSTITTTVSETLQSTLPTPASTTDVTDGQPTVSIPSSTTSMGSTTPAGWVAASATNAGAMPVQGASLSSTGHAFFGNHPVVIFVFLVTGIAIACMAALTFFCCRRRRGETQPRRRLEDISLPLPQNPKREDVKSNGGSNDQNAPLQSFINVPLNRSGDSLPTAHSDVDTPLPPPVMQRERRKSSYRVPVRYSGLGAHQGNSRAPDWNRTFPFSNYLPTQVAQTHPSPNVPPPLPTRSPLRLLADKNSLNTPQEDSKRLSRTSSPSLYPPSESISTSEGAIASEKISGVDQGMKKAVNSTQFPNLSSVASESAYSSWRARHLPVASRAPVSGPAQTSLLAEVCRMSNCPGTACVGRHTRLVDGRSWGA